MSRRPAFTLIELLVVTTIIGMLASMTLFALVKVQHQARVARTKSTIMKLHELLARRWESYATRRVPVNLTTYSPKDAAELRLAALRQLMRLEMPDRWSEVITPPTDLMRPWNTDTPTFSSPPLLARPALSAAYLRIYAAAKQAKVGSVDSNPEEIDDDDELMQQFQNAECLYMIIVEGMADDGSPRDLFSESEIGDVDKDGLPEFVDGWGMPIRFIRWPAGFVDDPRQEADPDSRKRFGHLSDLMPPKAPEGAASPLVACKPDAVNRHDPFDLRRIDSSAYELWPLIYSGGPDRIEDIYSGGVERVLNDPYEDIRPDTDPCGTYDPLATYVEGTPSAGTPKLFGIPRDLNSYRYGVQQDRNEVMNHYDNIHNHQTASSIR